MKRLLSMLLVLFLLTGCVKTPLPTEPTLQEAVMTSEAVAARYAEAAAVYDWFDLCSPPCVGAPLEMDGHSYRKVNVDGLTTYADLEAKVHSLFSPSLANEILSTDTMFREIDGILYCAEGTRDPCIDLAGKNIFVNALHEDHFTVEVLFWTDHPVKSPNAAADSSGSYCIGYSRAILDYEKTDAGFRFTNFCSSDALDLNADTVCFFPDRSSLNINEHSTDWDVICALLASDSSSFEEIAFDLPHRFLDHPQEVLHQLSLLDSSPLREYDDQRYLSVEHVLTWPMILYDEPDMPTAYAAALDACVPKTPAEQSVLNLLRQDFASRSQN